MYPSEQNYGSSPSTPVNSPPPLTSQAVIHNSVSAPSWQQLNPPPVQPSSVVLNNSSNAAQYTSDIVHRGIHMVNSDNYIFYFLF